MVDTESSRRQKFLQKTKCNIELGECRRHGTLWLSLLWFNSVQRNTYLPSLFRQLATGEPISIGLFKRGIRPLLKETLYPKTPGNARVFQQRPDVMGHGQ